MYMKGITYLAMGCLAAFTATAQNTSPHKNVLLLCIDDLRPELNSFGATHIHSPNIDQLAAQGRSFHRHYSERSQLRAVSLYHADGALRGGRE